jgi:hypothetical protein
VVRWSEKRVLRLALCGGAILERRDALAKPGKFLETDPRVGRNGLPFQLPGTQRHRPDSDP